MPVALLVGRLALSVVFLVAAVTKILDRPGTRQAVTAFGVPESVAGAVSLGLPAAEIAVALLLVPGALAWIGGAAALLLLAILSGAVTLSLVRGNQPECHCFGQIYSEPVSAWTLARNGVLALAAVIVLVGERVNHDPAALQTLGGIPADRWIEWIAGLLVIGLLVVQLWLVRRLVHDNHQLLIRVKMLEADVRSGATVAVDTPVPGGPGLVPGSPAPRFELPDLEGRLVRLDDLLAGGKPALLVFISPGCAACEALSPRIAAWQRYLAEYLTVVPISSGKLRSNQEKAEEFDLHGVLLQDRLEVELSLGVTGTPSALLIRQDGTIGSPVALAEQEIHLLLEQVVSLLEVPSEARAQIAPEVVAGARPDPAFGQPAPHFSLPDLRGRVVHQHDLLGRPILALFWWTDCPYCREMLQEIKDWDSDPPMDAPDLVIIATGDEARVQEQLGDLHSLVLLDHDFATAQTFGANGTPLAALIDADGIYRARIAGEPDILRALYGTGDRAPTAAVG